MKNSLYFKLSLAFFALVVLQSIGLLYVWHNTNQQYSNEITQRLNQNIAMYITGEHQLIADGQVNQKELSILAERAMVINPSVEVYLLSPEGEVISNLIAQDKLLNKRIDLAPLKEFLTEQRSLPILAQDPKGQNALRPFSVSPIMQDGQLQGYLYALLAGETHQGIIDSLANSHILTTGIAALVLNLVIFLVAAISVFYFFTRRLSTLSMQVKDFHMTNFIDFQNFIQSSTKGVLNNKKTSSDEIDQLSMCLLAMVKHMKEQFEHIQQVDSQRRELMANISHDLKTPLATVQGYVETVLIKNDSLNEQDRVKYLTTALKQSNKLAGLIDQLFELAKLESGVITPTLEIFSLRELIHDSMQDASWNAQEKKIQFNLQADDEEYRVKADIALIQRVVQNLLDNAIKYSPDNSMITIHLETYQQLDEQGQPQRKTSLTISDQGKGILAEDIPYIFERYYRSQQHHHSSKLGTGLGLAIVKKICDLHQTSISVSSVAGIGSQFKFDLYHIQ